MPAMADSGGEHRRILETVAALWENARPVMTRQGFAEKERASA
jgi:hypothetical protein